MPAVRRHGWSFTDASPTRSSAASRRVGCSMLGARSASSSRPCGIEAWRLMDATFRLMRSRRCGRTCVPTAPRVRSPTRSMASTTLSCALRCSSICRRREALRAIESHHRGRASRALLFIAGRSQSSATHINVRPTIYWLRQFAEAGFAPVPGYDASFVCPHAILLERSESGRDEGSLTAFAEIVRQRLALAERQRRVSRWSTASPRPKRRESCRGQAEPKRCARHAEAARTPRRCTRCAPRPRGTPRRMHASAPRPRATPPRRCTRAAEAARDAEADARKRAEAARLSR